MRSTTSRSGSIFTVLSLCCLLSACPLTDVSKLQGTNFGQGRLPGSAGSIRVQEYLINELIPISEGMLSGSSVNSYKQNYPGGTNILAVIPGTDLANEYIMMGAHYDHLGSNCPRGSGDHICNGATDNATGVAIIMDIARKIEEEGFVNRRSIIIALWDQEEQGLLGSRYYTNNPVVPLNRIAAYVNFDIMGANLLPSLLNKSFVIASESGGSLLENAVSRAGHSGEGLDLIRLTSTYGDQRSDHTNFLNRGVPSVFFTDGIGSCYHTSQDDIFIVDFDKLDKQIAIATSLVRDLSNLSGRSSFASKSVQFSDAQELLRFLNTIGNDSASFNDEQRSAYNALLASLNSIVDGGASNFGADDAAVAGEAGSQIVQALRYAGPCTPYHQ